MTNRTPDPGCCVCRGTGNRAWDDAWNSEAMHLEYGTPEKDNCYCVVGHDQLGNRWRRTDEPKVPSTERRDSMTTQATRPLGRPAQTPRGGSPAPAAPPPRESRMTLAGVRKGLRPAPDRILLVGTEGVGKSTFAAAAPSPIFLAAEDGVRHLDVASFPEPKSFTDVLDALRVLATEEHGYKTVVLDTVDWIEPLIWQHVCERNGWPTIEEPGYGKGYAVATEEWRRLLAALDYLRSKREMEVVLLAHATVKTFKNPAGTDFDRYECKLQKSAAALLREWCDANLFAVYEEFVKEGKGLARAKGVSTGARVLKTVRTAAWDAKNRHGLPEELPLDYAAYAEARAAGQPASAEALTAEIQRITEDLAPSEEARAAIGVRLLAAQNDAAKLAVLLNTLRERLAQQQAAAPTGAATTEGN